MQPTYFTLHMSVVQWGETYYIFNNKTMNLNNVTSFGGLEGLHVDSVTTLPLKKIM